MTAETLTGRVLRHLALLTPAIVLLVFGLVAAAGCMPTSPPPAGVAASIAAPGALTSADEKAMYALEAQLNRVAAIAKVVAPGLPRAERELRAAQLEDAWEKLQDLRCIHRAANGLTIAAKDAERCGRAVTIHGTDARKLLAEASAIAGVLTAFFGVE